MVLVFVNVNVLVYDKKWLLIIWHHFCMAIPSKEQAKPAAKAVLRLTRLDASLDIEDMIC